MINLCKQYVRGRVKPTEIGLIEFGINGIRLDAILVNCGKQHIRGFEFKVSRQDFLQDKKWHNYLKYCNVFSFVCPAGIIKKEEVEKEIGLIYVGSEWWRGYRWIKLPRNRKVDKDVYIQIISNMLLRTKYRKDEMF